VIHRDLKTSNVLVDEAQRPRITDFGLAKHLESDLGLTVSGEALGTPSFMSPEQAKPKQGKVGPGTDMRAFGGNSVLFAVGEEISGDDSPVPFLKCLTWRALAFRNKLQLAFAQRNRSPNVGVPGPTDLCDNRLAQKDRAIVLDAAHSKDYCSALTRRPAEIATKQLLH
jgi:serine/threonine protein kinase